MSYYYNRSVEYVAEHRKIFLNFPEENFPKHLMAEKF